MAAGSTAGSDAQRRRVAGSKPRVIVHPSVAPAEADDDGRAQPIGRISEQHRVEDLQHLRRQRLLHRGGAGAVAQQCGDHCGVDALALDVAEHDDPVVRRPPGTRRRSRRRSRRHRLPGGTPRRCRARGCSASPAGSASVAASRRAASPAARTARRVPSHGAARARTRAAPWRRRSPNGRSALAGAVVLDHGVHQHRQPPAVGARRRRGRSPGRAAAARSIGAIVGLVVDPAAAGQQVDEALAARRGPRAGAASSPGTSG